MKVVKFSNENYTLSSLDKLSAPQLVDLYNRALSQCKQLDQKRVNRFSTREVGVKRTWAMLQTYAELNPAPVEKVEKAKAVANVKPAKVKAEPTHTKPIRGTSLKPDPRFPVVACRAGSKQSILVDMLKRPGGASIDELLVALSGGRSPWVESTVRSGFGWDLKRKGYGVESRFGKDGSERFVLIVPEGSKVPEHTVSANAAKA